MKRVVAFTKVRFIMLILSVVVIIAGLAGVLVQGGLNLGIDFKGGLTEQIQILPVAMHVTYTGEGNAKLGISTTAVVSLEMPQADGADPEVLEFDSKTYTTLGILADLLSRIDDIQVELIGDAQVPTERLYPVDPSAPLSAAPFAVNMYLGRDEDIFAPIGAVRESLAELEEYTIQAVGNTRNQEYIIRVEAQDDDKEFQTRMETTVLGLLAEQFGSDSLVLKKSDFVGPRFSKDLGKQTVSLTVVALALILIYVSFRFRFIYAVAAIIALVHDAAIMVGVIGSLQLEVTTATIAAVLTIIGYSLNDTIVIFDRIRENVTLLRDSDLTTIINTSITQSLARTLITSLTTLLAVLAIYIFGTGEIRVFALSLIIGIVVGTYSSIFIASPTILGWQIALDNRRKAREAQRYGVAQSQPVQASGTAQQPVGELPAEAKPSVEPSQETDTRQPTIEQRKPRKKKKKRKR